MKKILILNWRDPRSPLEGGAERCTLTYAKYWMTKGHKIYWMTNSFSGALDYEVVDGITFIRITPALSGTLPSYILHYWLYLIKSIYKAHSFIQREKIDIVIDEIHGLPFFTPLFSKSRNILLVCELAGSIWDKMFPFPINVLGKKFESVIYHFYKETEIWAISLHTKKNIQSILKHVQVKLLPLGVHENTTMLRTVENIPKTKYPSMLFLARLVPMKGIENAIQCTADLVKKYPDFKLYVAGEAQPAYKAHLTQMVNKLSIGQHIKFLGKISELEKYKYLKKVHFLFHPSHREGYGLTVLEAGLVSTPSFARAGSALDELVGSTGVVFKQDSDVVQLFSKYYKSAQYKKLQAKSYQLAKSKTWDLVLSSSTILSK